MTSTGKEKIQHLESLYNQLQNPELYTCIRILKSNYDQFGTDTSIDSDILLKNNINHFKTNDARISETKHLTQCVSALKTTKNKELVVEIEKQLEIYNSILNRSRGKTRKRKTQRKYKKVTRKHKKARKY